ncbi:MAG: putative salt-induced outer membrane protein [Polaribacter sp.]|jgi:putative salt-induced outer membrane protein
MQFKKSSLIRLLFFALNLVLFLMHHYFQMHIKADTMRFFYRGSFLLTPNVVRPRNIMIKPFISTKKFKTIVLALSCVMNLSFSFVTQAEEVKTGEAPAWKSNVEFGLVSASGNTETTSINGAFGATYEVDVWKHTVSLKSLFSTATDTTTNEDTTSAERYIFQGKTDYKLLEDGYAFAVLDYDDDRFSDNDYQTSLALGRGFKFAPSTTSNLDLEVGLGYRQTKKKAYVTVVTNITTLFPEETINESVVRLAANYTADITENSKFEQKLSVEAGEESTVSKSYTGLSANVADNLALKISLTATHQSEVSAGSESLDTVTAVTLVYNF